MVRADQREAEAAAGLYSLPFPLGRKALFRTARSGQGRAVRRGEANPGRRGPFWDHRGRGKTDVDSGRFSETRASQTVALCVCQPWFYV